MFILNKDICDYTYPGGDRCDLAWMSVYFAMYLEFPSLKTCKSQYVI